MSFECEQCRTRKPLGIRFQMDADLEHELSCRSAMARTAFHEIRRQIFRNQSLSTSTRITLLQSLVFSKLFYGCGSWYEIPRRVAARLDGLMIRFYRSVIRGQQGLLERLSCNRWRITGPTHPTNVSGVFSNGSSTFLPTCGNTWPRLSSMPSLGRTCAQQGLAFRDWGWHQLDERMCWPTRPSCYTNRLWSMVWISGVVSHHQPSLEGFGWSALWRCTFSGRVWPMNASSSTTRSSPSWRIMVPLFMNQ